MIANAHLASADILALNATPFTIVPAAGASKVIIPLALYFRTSGGAAGYTFAGDVDVRLGGTPFNNTQGIASALGSLQPQNGADDSFALPQGALPALDYANTRVDLVALGGAPSVGDGDLDLWVVYSVVDIS